MRHRTIAAIAGASLTLAGCNGGHIANHLEGEEHGAEAMNAHEVHDEANHQAVEIQASPPPAEEVKATGTAPATAQPAPQPTAIPAPRREATSVPVRTEAPAQKAAEPRQTQNPHADDDDHDHHDH